ncbi:hypothetical protein TWF281_002180 [Arthrobotrys megalospora]
MEQEAGIEIGITIPYFAPNIPATLPTFDEIEAGEVLEAHYDGDWKISLVGDHFMVKYGDTENLSLIEGEHMMFVTKATNSRVKVPTVYALYTSTDGETPRNFIVMERIKGVTLDTLWTSLEEPEKQAIASRLKGYFKELRSIPAPGYYGSIGRRPTIIGSSLISRTNGAIDDKAFDSEDEFNKALARNLIQGTSAPALRLQLYLRLMNTVLKNHPPCFTYGNFSTEGVMVQGLGLNGEDVKVDELREFGFELTLFNWQDSGWLPTYWEYISATFEVGFDDEWHLWIANIVPTFEAEFCLFQTLYGAS